MSGGAITLDAQLQSVVREIGMRERVYPAWVSAKKMSQDKADHETAAMKAVLVTLNDYRAMQPKVLALSSVCLALAQRAGMDKEQLDNLLERAEETAKAELGTAANDQS